MRDFNNFELGDNVYKLANGIIPEIAERLEVNIGSEPNSDGLGELIGKLGQNKVLRDNEEVTAFSREEMADLVDRSGIQKALKRSLWTPEYKPVDSIVITGGVANWMDRSVRIVQGNEDRVGSIFHSNFGTRLPRVYCVTGNRIMDTATEINNPRVVDYHERFGVYPTEAEYSNREIVPKIRWLEYYNRLRGDERAVTSYSFDTKDGDEIARLLFENEPRLLEGRIGFARVATAGIQLAVQMRKQARAIRPEFDSNPRKPQVFVLTDSFPVSRTSQDTSPVVFQKAQPALRQLAVTAKSIYEASL